jgi:hypothetical protein
MQHQQLAAEGRPYSSIPNCRVPLIVAYPCLFLTYLIMSRLFPYDHTMVTYVSHFDRQSAAALLTRVNTRKRVLQLSYIIYSLCCNFNPRFRSNNLDKLVSSNR